MKIILSERIPDYYTYEGIAGVQTEIYEVDSTGLPFIDNWILSTFRDSVLNAAQESGGTPLRLVVKAQLRSGYWEVESTLWATVVEEGAEGLQFVEWAVIKAMFVAFAKFILPWLGPIILAAIVYKVVEQITHPKDTNGPSWNWVFFLAAAAVLVGSLAKFRGRRY